MLSLSERIGQVRLLILDVDGVLTDGAIVYGNGGEELKRFHVRDGSGLKLWQRLGYQTAILSGRSSPAVERRARELGIFHVWLGQADKQAALRAILDATTMKVSQVCAIGDDLQDLALLDQVGVRAAVYDACAEVRAMADYVTMTPGGHGAVRELIEWLLKSQGLWDQAITGLRPAG
jgi:3-deoxy-D-manno-octulosonate 8-phosphate phosphatase (KDO 8-P phosphatase)